MDNKKTELVFCNCRGCKYYHCGECTLPKIEIQDGECINYDLS